MYDNGKEENTPGDTTNGLDDVATGTFGLRSSIGASGSVTGVPGVGVHQKPSQSGLKRVPFSD